MNKLMRIAENAPKFNRNYINASQCVNVLLVY